MSAKKRKQTLTQKQIDTEFMAQALQLAEKGLGVTSPNPHVGALLVKNGEIVGRGYHRRAGAQHAEIAALKDAGDRAQGAEMYITLEPCCHHGRTGPCADAIVRAGIKRVCFATLDPNPQVNGRGARRLRAAGLAVTRGVLRKQSERLNDVYFSRRAGGRPFVILKTAQTLDGQIAAASGNSRWISGEESLTFAHKLRGEVDAVLVGSGTASQDDPELTVRRINATNPYRIIVSTSGKVNPRLKLFRNNRDRKTILATAAKALPKEIRKRPGLTVWEVCAEKNRAGKQTALSLSDLLDKALGFGINSLLVEGGSRLATSFLKAGLVDKHIIALAPMTLGAGIPAIGDLGARKISDAISYTEPEFTRLGSDLLFSGYPNNRQARV